MKKITLLVFINCLLGISQNPYYTKYSLEEGLPTSNVYSAFEDQKGYIWFATDVGVLKYDGYEFVHYNTDNGLGDNEVFKIIQDSKHRLWFLSLNGQLSYFKDGVFFNIKNDELLKKASYQKMLIDAFEDSEKALNFLYSDGKIVTIDTHLTEYSTTVLNVATHSIWKKNGKFNALTRKSIRNINTSEEILFNDDMMTLNTYRYYKDLNNYYFSIKDCIYEYVNNTFVKILKLKDIEIIFITKIDDDFWIGTRKGLYVKKNETLIRYYENHSISSVIKDSEDNFWVTTLNNGIKFIPNMNVIINDFNYGNLKINSIEKDENNLLWIGSEKGLHQLNSSKNFQQKIDLGDNQYTKKIRGFNNNIYVVGNNSIEVFNESKRKTFSFTANDIFVDNSESILASSVVFKFNSSKQAAINKDFKNISLGTLDKYKIFNKRTNVLIKGFNESVLLGSSSGLFVFKDNLIQKIDSDKGELNTSILDLMLDEESNRLLVASNSKGLISLKDNIIEYHLTTAQGLNSNGCNVIKKIKKNAYLVGTNTGLNQVEFDNGIAHVTNYSAILKNINERINDIEVIDSIVYLASDRGLLSFNYNTKTKKKIAPRLVIEAISVDGVSNQDLLNLSYDNNDITISFTGISYSDYKNINYNYKFINDKNWSTTKNRQLNFKDLSNGSYTLQIRSKGINNIYSPITNIEFIIKPPFWKRVPFVITIIVLLFLLTIVIIKKRIKKIQSRFVIERKIFQNEQDKMVLEKQMIELEQKAMRLQMNPHFIFNALNTIKGYYSGGNIKEANHYISKFSKLLRLILENDEHLISLDKETEILELYIKLIQLRYQNIFDYHISIPNTIIKEDIGIPPLLLQPIVENAIIHGLAPSNKKGILKINFSTKKDLLICEIIDNGVGFKVSNVKNNNHESKALTITKERVDFLNNSESEDNFQIKNLNNPTGTKIIIKLPLQNLWN